MKRVDFLKKLGIGLGAVVVAPMVLAEMPAKEKTHPAFNENLINKRLSELRKYPLTYDECYVPDWNPSMGVPEGWRICNMDDVTLMIKNLPPHWNNKPIDLNYKRGWIIPNIND